MKDDKGFFKSLMDSAGDALSFRRLAVRLLFFLAFGLFLGLRSFINRLDVLGSSQNLNFFSVLFAVFGSIWDGARNAAASIWEVFTHLGTYTSIGAIGSIAFTIIVFVLLMFLFFQLVSPIINLIDLQKGHATGKPLRVMISFFVLLVFSASMFYSGAGMIYTTPLEYWTGNGTINTMSGLDVVNNNTLDIYNDTNLTGVELDLINTIDLIGG